MLAESMRLASQTAEKINILSMLPYFPSRESLEAAQAGGVLEFGHRGLDRWQVRLAVPETAA